MGFLDKAIKRGLNRALGNAVENAVERKVTETVAPKVNQAVNSAADSIVRSAGGNGDTAGTQPVSGGAAETLGGALGAYAGAMQSFANEAAKNMKICPSCGEGAGKDQKFCPSCGAKLPETTVAEGAVCPSCGKQNAIGTKFCADCGAKLPGAIAEEQAAQAEDDAVMARWSTLLPQFPQWTCGGKDFNIEESDGYIMFAAITENHFAAQNAVRQYRELLLQNGFRQAGEYPSIDQLYKMVNGICYHCDTEHCFDGNDNCPTVYFNIAEPSGGFDYVKPAPKKSLGLKDLFKF